MLSDNPRDAKILVVDDQEINLDLFRRLFNFWGYRSTQLLIDSRATLPTYLEFRPDLILLDLHMPHLDGFQILQQLAPYIGEDEYVPILVLTGDITNEAKQNALAMGAKDFLTKPFELIEVQLRMANLLETRRLHLKLRAEKDSLEEKVRDRTQQLENAQFEAIECLAQAAEYRDDDTGKHTVRVGAAAGRLAARLGLPIHTVELIRQAAPLHDVGKIGIPDRILLKPGKLDPEEFEIVKAHTTIGASILSRRHFPTFLLASEIALTHHERWDGLGYPQRLSGEQIPVSGRIVAVADVFDALTHDRVYKAAWPVDKAVAEIRQGAGKQFDPAVVEAFLEVVDGLDPMPESSSEKLAKP